MGDTSTIDRDVIQKILLENQGKNFVDRILHKDKYPSLDLGDGNIATHEMAWGEADGRYFVYPTILWDGKQLKRATSDEAWSHAMKSGEFIQFDTPREADWFSKKYKSVWE